MPDLGVAGALVLEGGVHYDYRFTNINHVSGSCQLFRRECFEDIGGYVPVEGGGHRLDSGDDRPNEGVADENVRRESVRPSPADGLGGPTALGGLVPTGREGLRPGRPPAVASCARSVYQSTSRPYVIGGLMLLAGYTYRVSQEHASPGSARIGSVSSGGTDAPIETGRRGVCCRWGSGRSGPSTGGDLSMTESIETAGEVGGDATTTRGTNPSTDCRHYLRPLTFGNRLLQRIAPASRPPEPDQLPPAARHQAARIHQGPWLHGMGVSRLAEAHRRASGTGTKPSPAWSG